MNTDIKKEVQLWVAQVVIGLNLCPFAAQPFRNDVVRFSISDANSDEAVLNDLHEELIYMDTHPAEVIETSLLILKNQSNDFLSFNTLLNLANTFIQQENWDERFQIASFHPQYQFANTNQNDAENLTNRAPYPILHILRENSLTNALAAYSDPDSIYQRNIETMNSLSLEDKHRLFPYQNFEE